MIDQYEQKIKNLEDKELIKKGINYHKTLEKIARQTKKLIGVGAIIFALYSPFVYKMWYKSIIKEGLEKNMPIEQLTEDAKGAGYLFSGSLLCYSALFGLGALLHRKKEKEQKKYKEILETRLKEIH